MRPFLLLLLTAAMTHADELPDLGTLWDFSDPARTEARFRELLPRAEASGDSDYQLQLRTQIARTLGLRRKFDEAHAVLDEVAAKLDDDTPIALVRYLLERGRTFNSSKKKEKARPLFLAAWKAAQQCGADGLAVDAAHMMGIVEPAAEALVWNERALAFAEKSEQPAAKRWISTLAYNNGWLYHEQKEYEKAYALHEKCWKEREKAGNAKGASIAKWSAAKQLRFLKRHEEALALQRVLAAAAEKSGEEDGFVYEELGECLLALGRADEAQPWFAKAWPLLKEQTWLRDTEAGRLERLEKLAAGK